MARLGKIELFQKGVRDALLGYLPDGFAGDPERHPCAVQTTEWGEQYLWVSLVKGGLLNLGFGVMFRSFAEVNRIINGPPLPGRLDPAFSMSSMNMRQMKGLPYPQRFPLSSTSDEGFWHCEAGDPPLAVAQRTVGFVKGVIFPFFQRFSSLQAVRESLVQDDGWLMSGCSGRHKDVLLIDVALNDKPHFREYVLSNGDNKNFRDIRESIVLRIIEKFPAFAYESPDGRTSGMEATAG